MLFSLTSPERVSALYKTGSTPLPYLSWGCWVHALFLSWKRHFWSTTTGCLRTFPFHIQVAAETLRCHLKATRTIRPAIPSSNPDPLFISYVKPHKPISAPSLARWLRSLLKAPRVNSVISLRHIPCVKLQPLQLPIPTSHYLRFWRWLIGRLFPHFGSFITNLFTAQILHMLFSSETFCNFVLTVHRV